MDQLSKILSSKSRATIFDLLFSTNDQEYYLRELERASGLSTASIRFEMKNLISMEIIATNRDGNRLYYKANRDHPLYGTIRELVMKTRGPHIKLIEEFNKLDKINYHKFSKAEVEKRIQDKDHFLNSIKNEPKLFIKGTANDFEKLFE